MPYELSHLNALWDAQGKTTVRDEDGDVVTDEPFLHFPTGSDQPLRYQYKDWRFYQISIS